MARRKNQPEAVRMKFELAERLRLIRTELYGERGGPELARQLGVPVRTWYNYESGVTVPSELLLRFIELTAVEPIWLLKGTGTRYRIFPPERESAGDEPSVQSLLRTALQRLEGQKLQVSSDSGSAMIPEHPAPGSARPAQRRRPEDQESDPPGECGLPPLASVVADADWLSSHQGGGCVRVEGNAMVPIVADGAFVAYAEMGEDPSALEGKLVVAWIQGRPVVRWYEQSGQYLLLRAENPAFEPPVILLDLEAPPEQRRVRRILWIGTPH